MGEVAFRVKPDSDLHKKYFIALDEKRKFHDLANAFFKKYGLSAHRYCQAENLRLELTPEERDTFAIQIKKRSDRNGLYEFKKNSVMQKDWTNSVCSQIDFDKLYCNDFWYWAVIDSGSYALWHKDGEVYGLVESKYGDIETLPDYMERISLSKYYAIRDGE